MANESSQGAVAGIRLNIPKMKSAVVNPMSTSSSRTQSEILNTDTEPDRARRRTQRQTAVKVSRRTQPKEQEAPKVAQSCNSMREGQYLIDDDQDANSFKLDLPS